MGATAVLSAIKGLYNMIKDPTVKGKRQLLLLSTIAIIYLFAWIFSQQNTHKLFTDNVIFWTMVYFGGKLLYSLNEYSKWTAARDSRKQDQS